MHGKPFTQYSSFHGFYQALPSQIAFQWGNVKKQTDQDQTDEQNDIDGISSHLCRKDINKALVVVKSANPFHSCISIYVSIHSNRWNLLVDPRKEIDLSFQNTSLVTIDMTLPTFIQLNDFRGK